MCDQATAVGRHKCGWCQHGLSAMSQFKPLHIIDAKSRDSRVFDPGAFPSLHFNICMDLKRLPLPHQPQHTCTLQSIINVKLWHRFCNTICFAALIPLLTLRSRICTRKHGAPKI